MTVSTLPPLHRGRAAVAGRGSSRCRSSSRWEQQQQQEDGGGGGCWQLAVSWRWGPPAGAGGNSAVCGGVGNPGLGVPRGAADTGPPRTRASSAGENVPTESPEDGGTGLPLPPPLLSAVSRPLVAPDVLRGAETLAAPLGSEPRDFPQLRSAASRLARLPGVGAVQFARQG
ncbi:unnamed protein product [Lampetra fluviatilis]